MTVVDFGIIAFITLLLVLGLVWGFVKITIALATWIAASFIALNFAPNLSASLLKDMIDSDALRLGVAMGILFFLTLLIGALVSFLVRQLVGRAGLTGSDRILGMLLGISLGLVILVAMVFVAGLTPLPKYSWWQSSLLLERVEALAVWLQGYLPADVAKYFHY